jgi:phospholipid transport system transporter-binding protein
MKLPQSLTLDSAADALGTLQADAAGGQGTLAIDASALTAFDTAALALLLQARRLAQAGGRAFEVRGAPPKLTQLAQLYGVDVLLGLGGTA